MYPRRVVAWKAKLPGEVLRLYLILRASRMLQVKKGTQHTRNVAVKVKSHFKRNVNRKW